MKKKVLSKYEVMELAGFPLEPSELARGVAIQEEVRWKGCLGSAKRAPGFKPRGRSGKVKVWTREEIQNYGK